VQEPVEQVLAAIEREKARAFGSLVPDIESLERRVASLEEERNRAMNWTQQPSWHCSDI
jgi:hypothetical protein